jgi:hypothetical protein
MPVVHMSAGWGALTVGQIKRDNLKSILITDSKHLSQCSDRLLRHIFD